MPAIGLPGCRCANVNASGICNTVVCVGSLRSAAHMHLQLQLRWCRQHVLGEMACAALQDMAKAMDVMRRELVKSASEAPREGAVRNSPRHASFQADKLTVDGAVRLVANLHRARGGKAEAPRAQACRQPATSYVKQHEWRRQRSPKKPGLIGYARACGDLQLCSLSREISCRSNLG
jgi:hypothetical protein